MFMAVVSFALVLALIVLLATPDQREMGGR